MGPILRAILILAAAAALVSAQDDPPGRAARLNYVTGPVSFQPAGVTDWVDAAINRPLTNGDHLWVSDGARVEMHVGSTAVRLGANTAFQILNLNDRTMQLSVTEGTLSIRVRRLGDGENIEIDTPNMAFSVLRPGSYRIDANPDTQTTTVTALAGQGEVTGGGQAFSLPPRQQATITGDQQINYQLQPAPGPDDWDNWCLERDRREDHPVSARYVSSDVTGYEDLDTYGTWAVQPGYGPMWMPMGVAAGWAPYRFGHWAWVFPWGWTWVDDAPWGFAPFHYGRWAFIGGAWGWCPGPIAVAPVFAPAMVAWIGGPRFGIGLSFGLGGGVGWFPLGFGEPFIPAYHVSPGYFNRVNYNNTVINRTVNITNVYNNTYVNNSSTVNNIRYANQNVPGALTAVPRTAFASGGSVSRVAVPVTPNQARTFTPMTSPSVAPQRSAVLGAQGGRVGGNVSQPPAGVFNRQVVARTAPPPPPVPFARQQAALAQSPGRAPAPAALRQAATGAPARQPVRVVTGAPQRGQGPFPAAVPQTGPQARPQQPADSGWRRFGTPSPTSPGARSPVQNPPATTRAPASTPPSTARPPASAPTPRSGGWQQPARPPVEASPRAAPPNRAPVQPRGSRPETAWPHERPPARTAKPEKEPPRQ